MKCDRHWWNDGRLEREGAKYDARPLRTWGFRISGTDMLGEPVYQYYDEQRRLRRQVWPDRHWAALQEAVRALNPAAAESSPCP